MAETIRGVAVFWGLGSSLTATASGMGTFLPQGADFDVEAEEVEIPDYKGETVAEVFYNQKEVLKLEVIPTGANIAAAKAAAILPAPGAVVTVVDTDDTEVAGAASPPSGGGTPYIFIRGSKRRSNKDVVKLSFELKRYRANDVTTTVS